MVFSLGSSCLFYSFNNLEFYLQYPHLIRVDWGIPLLFGPLIYLYTLFLTNNTEEWSEKHYFHFFPYLINIVILIPFFIKSGEEKIQILDYFTTSITSGTDNYIYYNYILRIAISVIGISYAIGSLDLLKEYKTKLLAEFSDIDKHKLDWLKIILYFFLGLSIIFVITSLFLFNDIYPQFEYNVFYFILIFFLIYGLSYKTLTQPKIVSTAGIVEKPKGNSKDEIKSKKISEQGLRLKQYMVEDKPYLDGELTASQLAQKLNMTRHQLSELLNEEIGTNFYDLINGYRIEEFKKRLQHPDNSNLTLLAIAFDSGFNSKTSFNTIFKKNTGLTPSQFKKSQKKVE